MLNIKKLHPSTVEALKLIYIEQKNIVEHMQKSGTSFEKAIALMVCAAAAEMDESSELSREVV
jgi:hypothetical protein